MYIAPGIPMMAVSWRLQWAEVGKERTQNFVEETMWKMRTRKTEKEM
jgi:hypothetical protein